MARRLTLYPTAVALAVICQPSIVSAQELLAQTAHRGGGAYFAWWKILILVVVFLIWVRMADWVNRDSMLLEQDTGLRPEVWNPLTVLPMVFGFAIAISIPIFWIGLPVYLMSALMPPLTYFLLRRGTIKSKPGLLEKTKLKPGEQPKMEALPQDEGVAVSFTAAGDKSARQVNLIRARQTPCYAEMKELVNDGIRSRAEQIMIDYTREGARARVQIDGTWHPLPPMERQMGDSVLIGLKHLAGLNPADRRSRQHGRFQAKTESAKANLELVTQGTQTGERVQLKFVQQIKGVMRVSQLGMLPDQTKKLAECLNKPGFVIVSAPQGGGMTTSWQGILDHADRITRDMVGIVPKEDQETIIENIVPKVYDAQNGETPASILKTILLSQPDSLVVPQMGDADSMDTLLAEVEQERTIITRTHARSAAEALLRMYSVTKDRPLFEKSVTAVTCQRLLRRLCDTCKEEIAVRPEIIKQLGGDPRKQNTLFRPYRLPPPEQRVDENGKPIEMLPCETCGGIGFIGRVAAFETMFINDTIRKMMSQAPKVDVIESVARKTGNLSIQQQGFRLALLGITSVDEVQRTMKS